METEGLPLEGTGRKFIFCVAGGRNAAQYERSEENMRNYVQQHLQGGIQLASAIKKGRLLIPSKPTPPIRDPEEAELNYKMRVTEWEMRLKAAIKGSIDVEQGNKKLFALVWERSDDTIRNKLNGSKGFERTEELQDGIGLLGLIREIMCGVEGHLQPIWSIAVNLKSMFNFRQMKDVSNDEYVREFRALVKVVESQTGGAALA